MKAVRRQSRLVLTAFCVTLFALWSSADAQQPGKLYRIGCLVYGSRFDNLAYTEALRKGLRELGYVEGQTISLEWRYAVGKSEQLPGLAAELLRRDVAVIVAGGASAIRVAKKATETTPIVMAFSSDAVAQGFVTSLAKPGKNITGLSGQQPELGGKRLELLKEVIPSISRVAVVGISTTSDDPEATEIKTAAGSLGIRLQPVQLRAVEELESAFATMSKGLAGAVVGLQTARIFSLRKRIAEYAVKSRLPSISFEEQFAVDRWLMSYGPNYSDSYRRTAYFVDKLLKGAKPGDLPVEQSAQIRVGDQFENCKTDRCHNTAERAGTSG
jgi:putative ABC transport system substrate-binding protein